MRAVMAQKITATATDNLKALANFFMVDLLAGVLEIRTRGGATGFRFFNRLWNIARIAEFTDMKAKMTAMLIMANALNCRLKLVN
jgi:hypothetical protein